MAITSKGFAGGPMTDDDFGAIAARGAWVESAGAWAVTQPNTGTRTVAVGAGNAVAHGVRAINDAPISQALTAPGSGGQWYLLTARRDWTNGVKTTTLQVVSGASTGSTTTPTAAPTSLPTAFQSSPGTGQADQPLAWVWASSATTSLTIFDARLIDIRNRVLQATTVTALLTSALIAPPVLAAQFPCADGITYRWDGSTYRPWDSDWRSFNPAISFNIGSSGSITARYRYELGDIRIKVHVQFNGTGMSASTIFMDLPFKAASGEWPRGVSGRARDVSAGKSFAIYVEFTADASTNYQVEVLRTDSTYASTDTGVSGAVPWDAGDWVDLDFVYTPNPT